MHEAVVETGSAEPLSLSTRLLGSATVLLGYSLYFPINHLLMGREVHQLDSAIDHALPLSPAWMLAYGGIYFVGFFPLVTLKERESFFRALRACFLIELVSMSTFLLFPVRMGLRAVLPTEGELGLFEWLLQLCYFLDEPNCCFPSLHVSISCLAAFIVCSFHRRAGALFLFFATAISLSTLFVKQHYLADVLFGASLAGAAWWGALKHAPLSKAQRAAALPKPRRAIVWMGALYLFTLALAAVLWAHGFEPWRGGG
ncbi:MAG: phosphatase PAP2 family protein, partial [Myxococcota bacterium]|nr:phosphatase PAP2 family protein [Myxococcota bacterium]